LAVSPTARASGLLQEQIDNWGVNACGRGWSEATETKVLYGVYPIVSAYGKQENRLCWSCRIIGKNDSRVFL
jgi:hypothetical protein